ncbi:MAG: alpha/beta fold hydrolase [Acidobacteria bacterium]|nr:alpha/beta fold hydrolase [Acidobacteriota bacterium]
MSDVARTPEERFATLPGYPFAPHYLDWQGLRMHYVDEGAGKPVLLLHGEPTWSYLYRKMIPLLAAAGYRPIAPDYIGFGKSDKVTEDGWYTIERHIQSIRWLIESLDLRDITLVVHDWGGPIGLRQAVDIPERFERLVILNTWLHREGAQVSEDLRKWREYALGRSDLPCGKVVARSLRRPGQDLAAVEAAYEAPFPDAASKAGPRRFPWCLPFAQPVEGNAEDQARCAQALGLGQAGARDLQRRRRDLPRRVGPPLGRPDPRRDLRHHPRRRTFPARRGGRGNRRQDPSALKATGLPIGRRGTGRDGRNPAAKRFFILVLRFGPFAGIPRTARRIR